MSTQTLLAYLPTKLAHELAHSREYFRAEELRIRACRNISYCARGSEVSVDFKMSAEDINNLVFALAEHSLFSYEHEISSGYFTIRGGVRVGVAGRVISKNSRVSHIRGFTSLNIRFPRECVGVAKNVLPHITGEGRVLSTIIISPPGQGKTTLLRDAIRMISNGEGVGAQNCAVIDERCELFADGFDMGERTDVLSACPKSEGIVMALRSLCPRVIAMDEVGTANEVHAVEEAVNCGVAVIATAHATDIAELKTRPLLRELMQGGCIKRVAELGDALGRGTLMQIYDENGCGLLQNPLPSEVKP